MAQPRPITRVVCSECGEPWGEHISSASRRIADELEDDADAVRNASSFVSLEDCVRLLIVVHQGPMGPPGPTGAQGISG